MANSRSARKRIRASQRKFEHNRAVRSSVRTKVGKARRALLGADTEVNAADQLTIAISALDRAAEKGILHANNAARRKSRLMALANKLEAAAAGGEGEQSAARAAAVGGQKGRKSAGRSRATTSAAKPTTRRAGAGKASTGRAAPGKSEPAAEAKPARSGRSRKS